MIRPAKPARGENPFRAAARPRPIIGMEYLAPELFDQEALRLHFITNHEWISSTARTSREIHAALFLGYDPVGMSMSEILDCLNHALFEFGGSPSDASRNPTWTWDAEA